MPASGDKSRQALFVEQSMEFPLRYISKYKSLKLQTDVAQASYQKDVLELKAEARNVYLSWLAGKSKLKSSTENFAIANSFLDKTTQLNAAGQVGRIVLSRAKITLAQADLELTKNKNEELARRYELLALLGLSTDVTLTANDSLEALLPLDISFQNNIDTTKQIDFLLSQQIVNQNHKELNYQKWGFAPDLNFRYFKQTESNKYYGPAVGITVPLWAFSQAGAVKKAKANYTASRENYQQTALNINAKWKSLVVILNQYQDKMKQYSSLITDASSISADAKRAYDAGEIGYLEYLDAQQSYLQSKNLLIETQLNYLTTLTELYRLSGNL